MWHILFYSVVKPCSVAFISEWLVVSDTFFLWLCEIKIPILLRVLFETLGNIINIVNPLSPLWWPCVRTPNPSASRRWNTQCVQIKIKASSAPLLHLICQTVLNGCKNLARGTSSVSVLVLYSRCAHSNEPNEPCSQQRELPDNKYHFCRSQIHVQPFWEHGALEKMPRKRKFLQQKSKQSRLLRNFYCKNCNMEAIISI